jgi:type IV secretory pathway VirB10-like protein
MSRDRTRNVFDEAYMSHDDALLKLSGNGVLIKDTVFEKCGVAFDFASLRESKARQYLVQKTGITLLEGIRRATDDRDNLPPLKHRTGTPKRSKSATRSAAKAEAPAPAKEPKPQPEAKAATAPAKQERSKSRSKSRPRTAARDPAKEPEAQAPAAAPEQKRSKSRSHSRSRSRPRSAAKAPAKEPEQQPKASASKVNVEMSSAELEQFRAFQKLMKM